MSDNKYSYTWALGHLGAAKLFSSSVAPSLGIATEKLYANADKSFYDFMDTKDGSPEESKAFKKMKRLRRVASVANWVNNANKKANDILMGLLEACDFIESEVIEFVAKFIAVQLPAIEVSVKTVLLSNLKGMVNCAVDPRIPDYMRDEGITINERLIDPRGLLMTSPFSRLGRYNYFGAVSRVKDGEHWYSQDFKNTVSLYSLARAEDMNAFFWFTKNCARFVSPTVDNPKDIFNTTADSFFDTDIYEQKGSFYFQPGCVFKRSANDNVTFLCTDSWTEPVTSNTTPETITNTTIYKINEVSSNFHSCNWYTVPNKLSRTGQKPIFNLEYGNNYDARYRVPCGNYTLKVLPKPYMLPSGIIGNLTNSINVMGDIVDKAVSAATGSEVSKENWKDTWKNLKFPGVLNMPAKKATFDSNGVFSKDGIFSIDESRYRVAEVEPVKEKTKKLILVPNENSYPSNVVMEFDMKTNEFRLFKENNGQESELSKSELSQVLRECYCKNTVYDFNYDYLMSFKLFDAKVIAANLINSILNVDVSNFKPDEPGENNGVVQDRYQIYINAYVDKLVDRILEEDGNGEGEFHGCFYKFSNEEYVELEKETIEKLYSGTLFTGTEGDAAAPYDDIYEKLSSYDTDADLQEGIAESIQSAVKWSANISYTPHDPSSITSPVDYSVYESDDIESKKSGTMEKIVKFLTAELVNALLTPKVLMLIRVNMELMQSDPIKLVEGNFKELDFRGDAILSSVVTHITAAVKEIIDTVQKELLSIILARISEILGRYMLEIRLEQERKWAALLKSLLLKYKYYKNIAGSAVNLLGSIRDGLGSGDSIESSTARKNYLDVDAISFALDQVDYADIDELVGEIISNQSKEC